MISINYTVKAVNVEGIIGKVNADRQLEMLSCKIACPKVCKIRRTLNKIRALFRSLAGQSLTYRDTVPDAQGRIIYSVFRRIIFNVNNKSIVLGNVSVDLG